MKRSTIKQASAKQKIELALRVKLKKELIEKQDGKCAQCGKHLTYYNETADSFPHLSHKKRLSAGGKTDDKNCSVICSQCHSNEEHHLNNKYGEMPKWSNHA